MSAIRPQDSFSRRAVAYGEQMAATARAPDPGGALAPVGGVHAGDERSEVAASRRATALIFVATLCNALGNVAFHSLVARHAGTAGYGSVATLLSFGTVSIVVASGVQYAVARRTAQPGASPVGELRRGGRALGPWLGLSVLLALGAGPAASYLHLKQDDAVVFAIAYFASNIVQAVPLGVLIGQRRFWIWAAIVMANVATRLVLFAAFGSNGSTDTGALVASALATAISALLGAAWILAAERRRVPDGVPPTSVRAEPTVAPMGPIETRIDDAAVPASSEVGALAREGIGGALLGASLWVVWILPLVFARHYLPPGTAGRFGAAQFLASGVLFLVGAVTTAFFPSVARYRGRVTVVAGGGLAVVLSLFCVLGLVLLGPQVLQHLYGSTFVVSRQLFAVLGTSATTVALGTFALWISRAVRPTILVPSAALCVALATEGVEGVWWHTGPLALAAGPAIALTLGGAVVLVLSTATSLRTGLSWARPEAGDSRAEAWPARLPWSDKPQRLRSDREVAGPESRPGTAAAQPLRSSSGEPT